MYELFILGVYTLVILFFVPLKKIGAAQEAVKKWVKKLADKANN